MNNPISLANMQSGQNGTVVQMDGGYGMTRRLDNLGIRIGKKVRKVSSQLMRGPVIINHGNTRVAIGFGMAQRILVEIELP